MEDELIETGGSITSCDRPWGIVLAEESLRKGFDDRERTDVRAGMSKQVEKEYRNLLSSQMLIDTIEFIRGGGSVDIVEGGLGTFRKTK